MLKSIIILIFIFIQIYSSKVCYDNKNNYINKWFSLYRSKWGFNNYIKIFKHVCDDVSEKKVCVVYYLSRHPYIFKGYISHIGVATIYNKVFLNTYGLSESGKWNSPDILLEGKISKSKINIPKAFKFKIIGVKETKKNNLIHFKIEKVNYSLIGYNGENCADIVVNISNNLNHNISCNFLGINIPDFCIFN